MKKHLIIYTLVIISLIGLSCSDYLISDTNTTSSENTTEEFERLIPLSVGNQWEYNGTIQSSKGSVSHFKETHTVDLNWGNIECKFYDYNAGAYTIGELPIFRISVERVSGAQVTDNTQWYANQESIELDILTSADNSYRLVDLETIGNTYLEKRFCGLADVQIRNTIYSNCINYVVIDNYENKVLKEYYFKSGVGLVKEITFNSDGSKTIIELNKYSIKSV